MGSSSCTEGALTTPVYGSTPHLEGNSCTTPFPYLSKSGWNNSLEGFESCWDACSDTAACIGFQYVDSTRSCMILFPNSSFKDEHIPSGWEADSSTTLNSLSDLSEIIGVISDPWTTRACYKKKSSLLSPACTPTPTLAPTMQPSQIQSTT